MLFFFVGQVSGIVKYFNTRIYSHILNVITVKFCMMVLPIEPYLFTSLSQVTVMSSRFDRQLYVLIQGRDSLVVGKSAELVIERLRVRIPAGAAGEFSSLELTLCADSYPVSVPPPCYRNGT